MSYFVLGNVYLTFNLPAVFCFFETLRMFYPREGLCAAEPERGPIFFTLHFIGVGRSTGGFKFTAGERLFETLKMFYPPKGRLLADSSRGSIVFTHVLFWLGNVYWTFNF